MIENNTASSQKIVHSDSIQFGKGHFWVQTWCSHLNTDVLKTDRTQNRSTYENLIIIYYIMKYLFKIPATTTTSPEPSTTPDIHCPPGTRVLQDEKKPGGTCQPCEVGFYQSFPSQTVCLPCGAGLTTLSTGSRYYTDCFGTWCRYFLDVFFRPEIQ